MYSTCELLFLLAPPETQKLHSFTNDVLNIFGLKVAQNWFINIYTDRLSSRNLAKPDGWIGLYGH